jgi:translation elongation factor EF-Tu-like GTPase
VDFRLTVTDVFAIKGRGTVVTGAVEAGSISVGADIAISRNGQPLRRTKVTGVEMFRTKLDTAVAGQHVGLLLDQVERDDVAAGDVLTA